MITNQNLLVMYKKEISSKKKERLLAMYKIIEEKLGIAEVARMLLKSYNTIKNWLAWFLENGTDRLDELPRSGRPRRYEHTKITDFIEDSENDDLLRFPKYLAHKLDETLGIKYKVDTIRSILRGEGYSPKVPQLVHVNRANPSVMR